MVAKNPASCRKFKRETAVVDPPNVFRRFRKAFHSYKNKFDQSTASQDHFGKKMKAAAFLTKGIHVPQSLWARPQPVP